MEHRGLYRDDLSLLHHSVAVEQLLIAADGERQVEGPEPCSALLHRALLTVHQADYGLPLVGGLVG